MVGDPQQLPATIFSVAAKQLALERSLFERLSQVRAATLLAYKCTA
jgi:superfamily I DNA and/or RNA helicase